jgi:hypothetical protein
MKKKIGVTAVLGLLAMAAFTGPASATGTCIAPTFISFNVDTVLAYETNYVNATYTSNPGSVLTILAKVTCFGPPFTALNGTSKEYSVVITSLVSLGTVHTLFGTTDIWDTDYSVSAPATFALYEDNSADLPAPATAPAPAAALALFDGSEAGVTTILSGQIDYFHTQITENGQTPRRWGGSFNALYHATGGTLFGLVGNGQANLNGLWCSLGTGLSQCSLPAGYSAHPSGKFDQPGTTPTQSTTWGRIKTIYR